MLDAEQARPRATAFGADAYPTLEEKSAALLHLLGRYRALVDDHKRLALAATIALFGIDGRRLVLTNEEAYDLVIAVATAKLDDVGGIAEVRRSGSRPPRSTGGPPVGRACQPQRSHSAHHASRRRLAASLPMTPSSRRSASRNL